jgi:predicted regulator of Ras-like GTPase activity (Roadblock/LC7/MglB family)
MLKKILMEFLSIDSVITAALVGRDGFVIEIVQKNRRPDIDAIGALCSGAMRFFEQGGATMGMGAPRQVVFEYRYGAVIIIRLTPDEFLVIITDTIAGLGHLSFTLAKTSSRVAAAI